MMKIITNNFRFLLKLGLTIVVVIHLLRFIPLQREEDEDEEPLDLHICDNSQHYFTNNKSLAPGAIYDGVFRFRNVCIENIHRDYSLRHIKIVVYSQHTALSKYRMKVKDFPYDNMLDRKYWTVEMKTGDIPKDYKVIDGTAFFIILTFPGNIFHFLEETFYPVFSIMHKLGLLCENTRKYFLYSPHDEENTMNMAPKRYEWFFRFINVDLSHDIYYKTPVGTCFTDAVFGHSNLYTAEYRRFPVEALRRRTPRTSCPPRQAIIIKRDRRRILNIDQVAETLNSAGYHAVITRFEKMTKKEQFLHAKCSTLVVGVRGAALEWGQFMDPGSTIIEIVWPDNYWPSDFEFMTKYYSINHKTFKVSRENVFVNWTSYEYEVRDSKKLSVQEKDVYLQVTPRTIIYDNIWKWADVRIDIPRFKQLLKSIV